MQQHDFELRLEGTGDSPGVLRLDTLSEICRRLQELSRRIARHVAAAEVGRTPDHPADASRLVLRGIRAGSTVLEVGYGEPDVLPLDAGQEIATAARFWEVLAGIADGVRPLWVPALVAGTAGRLIDATTRAAERITVERRDGATARWTRIDVLREPWLVAGSVVTDELVTVVGRLERVDLRSRRFRIRDETGQCVELQDVLDADAVGPLVGQRTAATGLRVVDERGRRVVAEPVVIAAPRLGGAAA